MVSSYRTHQGPRADNDLFEDNSHMSFTQMSNFDNAEEGDQNKENSPLVLPQSPLRNVQYGNNLDYDENMDEGMPDYDDQPPPESMNDALNDGSVDDREQIRDSRDQRSQSVELGSRPKFKTKPRTNERKPKEKAKKEPHTKKLRIKESPKKGLSERRINMRDLESRLNSNGVWEHLLRMLYR